MGMETPTPPIMLMLNPNASEFVLAAARPAAAATVESRIATPVTVIVAAAPQVVVPEYTPEWWSLIATDQAFREHYLSNCHFQSAEQRDAFVDSLDELADDHQFHGYQEHLVDLEEEDILRRNLAEIVMFLRSRTTPMPSTSGGPRHGTNNNAASSNPGFLFHLICFLTYLYIFCWHFSKHASTLPQAWEFGWYFKFVTFCVFTFQTVALTTSFVSHLWPEMSWKTGGCLHVLRAHFGLEGHEDITKREYVGGDMDVYADVL